MPELDTYLSLYTIGANALADINDYNDANIAAQQSYIQYRTQTAINNNLLYNKYSNLNEQEQLDFQKHSLDKFELQKQVRRKAAELMAFQGSNLKSGGSADSILLNIQRQGYSALHRKDFNYEIRLRNLAMERNNAALATQSANNKAYNAIRGVPSATGLALSIAGNIGQIGSTWAKGRKFGDEGKGGSPPVSPSPAPSKYGTKSHGGVFAPTVESKYMGK